MHQINLPWDSYSAICMPRKGKKCFSIHQIWPLLQFFTTTYLQETAQQVLVLEMCKNKSAAENQMAPNGCVAYTSQGFIWVLLTLYKKL